MEQAPGRGLQGVEAEVHEEEAVRNMGEMGGGIYHDAVLDWNVSEGGTEVISSAKNVELAQ